MTPIELKLFLTGALPKECTHSLPPLCCLQEAQLQSTEHRKELEERLRHQTLAEEKFFEEYKATLHDYQAQLMEIREFANEGHSELKNKYVRRALIDQDHAPVSGTSSHSDVPGWTGNCGNWSGTWSR